MPQNYTQNSLPAGPQQQQTKFKWNWYTLYRLLISATLAFAWTEKFLISHFQPPQRLAWYRYTLFCVLQKNKKHFAGCRWLKFHNGNYANSMYLLLQLLCKERPKWTLKSVWSFFCSISSRHFSTSFTWLCYKKDDNKEGKTSQSETSLQLTFFSSSRIKYTWRFLKNISWLTVNFFSWTFMARSFGFMRWFYDYDVELSVLDDFLAQLIISYSLWVAYLARSEDIREHY